MADGGIHDQLGGGFHRYSTDAIWLVPHFEKMLYDNAQLARVYLHALAGDRRARATRGRRDTLDYVARELHDRRRHVRRQPGCRHRRRRGRDVHLDGRPRSERPSGPTTPSSSRRPTTSRPGGNWEGPRSCGGSVGRAAGRPIWGGRREVAARAGRRPRSAPARSARERPQPARDDKALAAWNGLAIAAFAEARSRGGFGSADAALALSARPRTAPPGARRRALATPTAASRRSWKDGRAGQSGVLEDYADLAEGLLALYEATFDERWFAAARELAGPGAGALRATRPAGSSTRPTTHETLVDAAEGRPGQRGAVGQRHGRHGAAAAGGADRRGALPRRGGGGDRTVVGFVERYPTAFAQWLVGHGLRAGAGRRGRDRGPRRTTRDARTCSTSRGRAIGRTRSSRWPPTGAASAIQLLPGSPAIGGRADRVRLPRISPAGCRRTIRSSSRIQLVELVIG